MLGYATANFLRQNPQFANLKPVFANEVTRGKIVAWTMKFVNTLPSYRSSFNRHRNLFASNLADKVRRMDDDTDLKLFFMSMLEQRYCRILMSLAQDIANGYVNDMAAYLLVLRRLKLTTSDKPILPCENFPMLHYSPSAQYTFHCPIEGCRADPFTREGNLDRHINGCHLELGRVALKRHQTTGHAAENAATAEEAIEAEIAARKFVCGINGCLRRFKREDCLKRHQESKAHRGWNIEGTEEEVAQAVAATLLYCDLEPCRSKPDRQSYASPATLKQHKKTVHIDPAKLLYCDIEPCRSKPDRTSYTRSATLKRHKNQKHPGWDAATEEEAAQAVAKRFKCDQCPRDYSREDDLKAHKKTHEAKSRLQA